MGEDVSSQVNARCNFGEGHAICRQLEDTTLGDVEHRLLFADGVAAAEGDLLDIANKFTNRTLSGDLQSAVDDLGLQPLGGEGAHEDDFF